MILAARASDHNPVVLSFHESIPENRPYWRGFKFEACWLNDVKSREIIKRAWSEGAAGTSTMANIQDRLSMCQRDLIRWSCRKFGNV
jgi:hypothetical protein